MNRLLCTAALVLLVAGVGRSQAVEKTVGSIRVRYDAVSEKARLCETDDEHGEIGSLVMNELRINSRGHQWRAVGIYGQVFRFFYTGVENDEKRLYPDQLVFVKTERRVSDRKYFEEFLFSDAGVLMFYYQRAENDSMVPAERRIYFMGRAIRIVEDGKARDRLGKQDLSAAAAVSAQSRDMLELFKRSIQL